MRIAQVLERVPPRLRKALVIALSFVLMFLVLEVGIRVVYALAFPESVLEKRVERWVGAMQGVDEDMREELAPWERLGQLTVYDDPDLLWRNARSKRRRFRDDEHERGTVDVFTSTQGFNTPEFFEEQRPGSYRILAVGSSFTFSGYPQQLENLLQWLYPDKQFEVLNCAVPGYTTYQYRRLIEKQLSQYTFDAALCDITGNEFTPAVRPDSQKSAAVALSPLTSRSELFKLIDYGVDRLLRRRPAAGDGAAPGGVARDSFRVPVAEFEDNVRAIATTLAAHCGEAVVFLVMSHMPPDYTEAFERAVKDTGARWVNVNVDVRKLLGAADWQTHYVAHPDGIGNRVMAAVAYRGLSELPSFRKHLGAEPVPFERVWEQ